MFRLRYLIGLAILAGLLSFGCDVQADRAQSARVNQADKISQKLNAKDLEIGQPVFIRIYKSMDGVSNKGVLELFIENHQGYFELYDRWEICAYSGALGPKLKEGDGQSPEGFYFVKPSQMNPTSQYHLSFNLGFPNAFDRAHGRTGSFLMVHGDCVSIGCYAMTDPVIEEIYSIMLAAFDGGQPFVRVHAFPFPMHSEMLESVRENKNAEFWKNLKEGWDWFETHRYPPNVEIANKRYVFSKGN